MDDRTRRLEMTGPELDRRAFLKITAGVTGAIALWQLPGERPTPWNGAASQEVDRNLAAAVGMARPAIQVVLADEQGLFREAVRIVLTDEPDIDLVADAGDEEAALDAVAEFEPDVALVSMALCDDGLSTARSVSESLPECRVVMLAPRVDPATLVDAYEAGASGYLSKQNPISELVDAIRAVHSQGILVPPGSMPPLIRSLVERQRERDETAARYGKLTAREREVLSLLITGADDVTIGRALRISAQTVTTHV
jgi:two-component system NarL family response regulator